MRSLFCYFVVVVAAMMGSLPASAADRPPNFVVLFADDLGYGDLGCYGHPNIRTPNLDRMAAEGIRMTSFYAAASCSPARALLLTGRYPHRTGIYNVLGPGRTDGIRPSEITLAEALKTRGYRTAAFGKWHLGHSAAAQRPLANGFDEYFGLLYSNDMIRPWVQTDAPLRLWDQEAPLGESPVDQDRLTVRYTERAVRFIDEAKDEPFFLYLPYSMVHLPIHTADEFRGQSRAGLYGDVVQAIDWSVGEILRALREAGVEENTLVMFTSDNGPWLGLPDRMLQNGNEPWHAGSPGLLRGWKGNTYEGGVRVPFIARWPGRIPAGQISSGMGSILDIFATITRLAGAELPADLAIDGVDLMAHLDGRSPSPRRELFHFRRRGIEAIRVGPWKLRVAHHMRDGLDPDLPPPPELFHLDLDPSERFNRAEEFPEKVEALSARMEAFLSGR